MNEILLARVVSASRPRRVIPLAAAASVLLAVGAGFLVFRSDPPPAEKVLVEAEAPAPVVVVSPLPPLAPTKVAEPPPPVRTELPEPPKPETVAAVPKDPPKPPPLEKPEVPIPVDPSPLVKETIPAPPTVDDKAYSPVFVLDAVGDLWLRRDQSEAKAGVLEKAAWKDRFAARSGGASFSLEARTSVMLEKGSDAAFSHRKTDDSYSLALGQGLVLLDTEGSSQKWRITFGRSELDFNQFNGRLAVESKGDRMSALLLDGSAELKIGTLAKKAQIGQEIVLSREGQVVEQKGETQRKLARLDELRPKVFTAFAVTFDEKRDDSLPYPYTILAGRPSPAPSGIYLQSEPFTAPKPGVAVELRLDRPFGVVSGMAMRFRYRTTHPSFSVNIGKYSVEVASRVKAGQWIDAEIPLRELTFEGTPMLPTDPVENVRFAAVSDRKNAQLDIDGVQFLRRVR